MQNKSWAPLWEPARIAEEVSSGVIHRSLNDAARLELAALAGLEAKVVDALTDPKPLDICMPVLNAVLAAQYYEIFEALQPPRNMAVYEPCVGASNPVLVATEAYSRGEASYLTINLNAKLCTELKEKIAHLKISVRIIEDNAQSALSHLPPRSFDLACFHHAVNDILQTAVSEPRGMDTTAIDWFPNERQMIEWLAEEHNTNGLVPRGTPELMQIVNDTIQMVRPGGYLVFDHFNWCRFIGVQWFPWDLFYNLIPLTRRWITESKLPVTEVHLDGVDRQWWMILQVNK